MRVIFLPEVITNAVTIWGTLSVGTFLLNKRLKLTADLYTFKLHIRKFL